VERSQVPGGMQRHTRAAARNDLATDETALTDEMAVFGTHPYKRSHGLARGLCNSLYVVVKSAMFALVLRGRRTMFDTAPDPSQLAVVGRPDEAHARTEPGPGRLGASGRPERRHKQNETRTSRLRSAPRGRSSGSAGRALQPLGFALCAPFASLRCS
jgi:hypothetical protein